MARQHFERENSRIKRSILELSTMVEELLFGSITAFLTRDRAKAEAVVGIEESIDRYEVEIEEDCLKTLALYQPVAGDLRFIVAVLKINEQLERVADLATRIAYQSIDLKAAPIIELNSLLDDLAKDVRPMLAKSIDCFIHGNRKEAEEVCEADSAIDKKHKHILKTAEREITRHPESVSEIFLYISVSQALERIADLATNIAEDVLYLLNGRIVRHKMAEELSRDE